jgi:hypothetical protein
MQLNSKTLLKRIFKNFVFKKGIKLKHTALNTLTQNSRFKRFKRVIITKACIIRIEANLFVNI